MQRRNERIGQVGYSREDGDSTVGVIEVPLNPVNAHMQIMLYITLSTPRAECRATRVRLQGFPVRNRSHYTVRRGVSHPLRLSRM